MNLDDPKLTAYALGELSGEERLAMEAALEGWPEGRAYVEETAAFAGVLSAAFQAEGAEERLDSARRLELMGNPEDGGGKIVRFSTRRVAWAAGLAAMAAALAAAPFLPFFRAMVGGRQEPTQLASASPEAMAQGDVQARGNESFSFSLALADEISKANKYAGSSTGSTITVQRSPRSFSATGSGEWADTESSSSRDSDSFASADMRLAQPRATADSEPLPNTLVPAPTEFRAGGHTLTAKYRVYPEGSREAKIAAATKSTNEETVVVSAATLPSAPAATVMIPPSIPPAPLGARRTSSYRERTRGSALAADALLSAPASPISGTLQEGGRSAASFNTEAYAELNESAFLDVAQNPLSTFSIDVDTASYSNVRRFLMAGQRPPAGAVRIEELINYFHYDYPQPKNGDPFSTNVEVSQCPWRPENRLVRIGLKGRETPDAERAGSNLVFLIDASGSMDEPNKMPLLKQSMRLLVEKLGENDKVSIVVYAGAAGLVLPPTGGDQKEKIFRALEELRAGGSTNGGQGIRLAYETAALNKLPNGINRVILATDGDFNVGTTSESELVALIAEKAKSGVFLTVLGFGQGNLKDATMEKLADRGNGHYAYIDSLKEGRKVLVEQIGGTLETIAKDVKIQVEFNPAQVSAYRLVGYENRALKKEDFNDDKKDAGEIGSGHTVTALYEVVPAGGKAPETGKVDALKYRTTTAPEPKAAAPGAASDELLTVKLRYKKPAAETSLLIEVPVRDGGATLAQSSPDFRFAAAVAEFGMLLRGSGHAGLANWESVHELAVEGKGADKGGYRAEFLELIGKAKGVR